MAGIINITPNQAKARYKEESDKFGFDANSSNHSKDSVALSFQEVSVSNNKEPDISISYSSAKNAVEVSFKGEEANQSSVLSVIDQLIKDTPKIKEVSPSGEFDFSLDPPVPSKKRKSSGIEGFLQNSKSDAIGLALRSDAFARSNSALSARDISVQQSSDGLVSAIKFLCDQNSVELKSDIEQIIDFSGEAPIEFEEENKGAIVASHINKNVQLRGLLEKEQISVSGVREKIQTKRSISQAASVQVESRDVKISEAIKERPVPAQVKAMAFGNNSMGVFGDRASSSVYGSLKEVKKLVGYELDAKGRPQLGSPIYRKVTVEEIVGGLSEGKYVAVQYEDPEIGIEASVKGQPANPVHFKVKTRKPASNTPYQVASGFKDKIEEMEKQAERIAATIQNDKQLAEDMGREQVREQRKNQSGKMNSKERRYIDKLINNSPKESRSSLLSDVKALIEKGASGKEVVQYVEEFVNKRPRAQASSSNRRNSARTPGVGINGGTPTGGGSGGGY